MDIYKSSINYAKENGELEQYRESMNLCDECGTFISHSIAENFNNNYLDVKKVTAEAAGKYGFERAMLMQFELTDEECNGIWDMVEQQNVESHFTDLLSENGFDVNSADVKKVITEMAAQYREDFGFGDDEEFQGYISERDDDLKEHLNSEMFGDVYVDNVTSDYTGRIMIIRPEYFSSRSFTPERSLC